MATLKNTTVDDTGYVRLPKGTTAQRPGTPLAGYTRYNTSLNSIEYYTGSTWTVVGLADGSSATAAPIGGCNTILSNRNGAGLSSPDGTYWINPAGTGAYQVYCDMTTDGGGWTLVISAQCNNGGLLVSNRDAIIANTYTVGDASILSDQTMVSRALYQVKGDNFLQREHGRSGWMKASTWTDNTSYQCLNNGEQRTLGYWFNQGFVGSSWRRQCNQAFSSPLPTGMWAYYNFNNTTGASQWYFIMFNEASETNNYAFISTTNYDSNTPQSSEGDNGLITTDASYTSANEDYGQAGGTWDSSAGTGHFFVR